MGRPRIPEAEFIEMFESIGPTAMSVRLKQSERRIYERRKRLEEVIGRSINIPNKKRDKRPMFTTETDARIDVEIETGVVLVGSDAHYRPGQSTTAHRAFVKFCDEMRPKFIVKNGDALDFPSISRHASIGWEQRPSVIQEIECAKERLGEIEAVAHGAGLLWPLGNHDSRFESRLAQVAPEYARVHGMHLKDHFMAWRGCWMIAINDDVIIKHRFKAGIHAPHNNVMWAGKTMVTGHLHSLKVMPLSDYNGTRFGVDCGTLAEPYGPQFADYTELNPVSWRSGFAVLTFVEGKLLWPEVAHVIGDGLVDFRGKIHEV